MAKTRSKQTPILNQQTLSDPQWITEMRDHFQKTGIYRAEDLQRVLGDPRDSVQVQLDTGLVLHSRFVPFVPDK